jgi:hypothetical protein
MVCIVTAICVSLWDTLIILFMWKIVLSKQYTLQGKIPSQGRIVLLYSLFLLGQGILVSWF